MSKTFIKYFISLLLVFIIPFFFLDGLPDYIHYSARLMSLIILLGYRFFLFKDMVLKEAFKIYLAIIGIHLSNMIITYIFKEYLLAIVLRQLMYYPFYDLFTTININCLLQSDIIKLLSVLSIDLVIILIASKKS
jgi:hypothetical protein